GLVAQLIADLLDSHRRGSRGRGLAGGPASGATRAATSTATSTAGRVLGSGLRLHVVLLRLHGLGTLTRFVLDLGNGLDLVTDEGQPLRDLPGHEQGDEKQGQKGDAGPDG